MSRDILFRGQECVHKTWILGDLLHGLNGHIYIRHVVNYGKSNEYVVTMVDTETVGQFTGLTDKNGTRIFEGDVIHVYEFKNIGILDMSETERSLFEISELKGSIICDYKSDVRFLDGEFIIKSDSDDYDTPICCLFGNMKNSQPIFEFEVIGNIHELLK